MSENKAHVFRFRFDSCMDWDEYYKISERAIYAGKTVQEYMVWAALQIVPAISPEEKDKWEERNIPRQANETVCNPPEKDLPPADAWSEPVQGASASAEKQSWIQPPLPINPSFA